ncbi:MAG: septal ring lytic transglycosylase RlpA family protein [Candidatus Binatia bacterium]
MALLLCGCSLPPLANWHGSPRPQASGPYVETGTASWYGPGFLGERTSSGEVFVSHRLTAAHPTLPLGTRVVVTNLENARSVSLRINDRGPFIKGRIIDLSPAAAHEIGLVEPGTAAVRVETPSEDEPPGVVVYAVQVGAFQNDSKADAFRARLARRYQNVYLSPHRTPASLYYRVRLGPFERRDDAELRASQLTEVGLGTMIVEEVHP